MNHFKRIVLIFLTISGQSNGDLKQFFDKTKDVSAVGLRVTTAFAKNVPKLLPSTDEITNFGKQALAGYPLESLTYAISSFCSHAISLNATIPDDPATIESMNYVLLSDSGNLTVPIQNSELLWNSTLFDPELDVIVFVTGWLTSVYEPNNAVEVMYAAYKKRGTLNFIVLDTARHLTTLYTWSAFNTNLLGEALGKGLAQLADNVPLEKIHVIGHSLGAHISGAAGRSFQKQKNGNMLPRITGLDPANPCFNEGESLNGLMRGDAEFVDVIHSNVRVLGKREPIGDVDFYLNGMNSIQPGCLTVTCSHSLAWKVYAETVSSEDSSYMATKCNSLSAVLNGYCASAAIPLGYNTPKTAKGNYFLQTN